MERHEESQGGLSMLQKMLFVCSIAYRHACRQTKQPKHFPAAHNIYKGERICTPLNETLSHCNAMSETQSRYDKHATTGGSNTYTFGIMRGA